MANPSQILKPNKVKSPVPFREDWKGLLTCHGENQESQGCFHRGCHLFLPSSAAHTRKLADEEYFPRFPLLCAHFAVSKVWNREKKKKDNEQGGLQRFHCERWVRVDAFCQSAPTVPLVLELWLRAVETGCRDQSPPYKQRFLWESELRS